MTFDLEKVQAAIEEAVDRLNQKIDDEDGPIWEKEPEKAAVLQTLLAEITHLEKWVIKNRDIATDLQYQLDDEVKEIERLRAALLKSDNSNRIRRGITEGQDGLIVELDDKIQKQAARIKELESSLDEAEALTKKNAELMNGYLRRIAELEDALVGLKAEIKIRRDCAGVQA